MAAIVEMQPELTAISLAFRNQTLIGSQIFKKVPVTGRSFQYRKFDRKNNLTVPETKIGQYGNPNRINNESGLVTETVETHALEEAVSIAQQKENLKAAKPVNLRETAVIQLTDVLQIRREIELAKKLGNVSNYGSNKVTLNSGSKIDIASVNAHKIIRDALKAPFYRPNTMIASKDAFFALQDNPYIVSAVKGNDVKAGSASIEEIKRLYGLTDIFIGEGVHNQSKKADAPDFASCWNNDIILAYMNPNAITVNDLTFGYTAQYSPLTVTSYNDGRPGTEGAEIIKVYYEEIDLIVCPECGFIIKDVLSA